MSSSQLDYDELLRRVVHDALAVVAEHGLSGQHQLYITFRTDRPGVVLGEVLRARYPTEMTIVLQHEFWGLEVRPDGFAVTLSFNNVSERLEIPFAAIRVFADPSVEFGLQFTVPAGPAAPSPPAAELTVVPRTGGAPTAAPAADAAGSAEVVTLDRFRKK